MPSIAENIKRVRESIANKLKDLGRPEDDVTLVAVTKTHPLEFIETALQNGITHIGENKVQEAMSKIPLLDLPYEGFHFIGHLQSNKINKLLSLKPILIHSIDSLHIAKKLNDSLGRKNLTQDILVQVNTTGEESKTGVNFANAEDMVWQIAALPCLRVKGLMTIGMLSNKYEDLFHAVERTRGKDPRGVNTRSPDEVSFHGHERGLPHRPGGGSKHAPAGIRDLWRPQLRRLT